MPQVISFHSEPKQVNGYIEQALVLLDAHELTTDERARLLPTVVELLAEKPIGMQPDVPLPRLAVPTGARH